jgi:predicted esterase
LLLVLIAPPLWGQSYGETHRLRVDIDGTNRKVAFFVPRNIGKGEALPMLVALPDGSNASGLAFKEVGQFEQMGYEKRFCVVSVDITTSGMDGWHPNDAVAMERDIEAVMTGIAEAKKKAKELGFRLDLTATTIRGHSGACNLALWAGVRHPETFLAVSLNGVPKYYPEFLNFKGERNKQQIFFIYSGERDVARVKRETEKTVEALRAAGYGRMVVEIVKGMAHEPKPEVFVGWFANMLRETRAPRKEAMKIEAEAEELRGALAKGKTGVYRKIVKLAEREKKAGFGKAATILLAEVTAEAEKQLSKAEDLAAEHEIIEAAALLRKIEKKYNGLPAAKSAKAKRGKLVKSDEYKAAEMLAKARELREKGRKEKAAEILVKLIEKFPDTVSAERAQALLDG